MGIKSFAVLLLLVGGVGTVGFNQLFSVQKQANLAGTSKPEILPVTTTPVVVATKVLGFGDPMQPADNSKLQLLSTSSKDKKVEVNTTPKTLELDKTYYASDSAQKQFIANDPVSVVISSSSSTIPTAKLAAKYKANVEKGPLRNQTGWPHIVIDSDGKAYSIVSIYKTVQNTMDRYSGIFNSKGKLFKNSVDQNSIQIELHGKITDKQIQSLGLLLKELNADGTMPANRVFPRWAVTPTTSDQDNYLISPKGVITAELSNLVRYAGYGPGSEKIISLNSIQNKILLQRSKFVLQTKNDFKLEYLVKAYNKLK
jgi:N-acetylmuramoyl-L-alanine amidase